MIEFGDCRETMRRWKEQGVKAQTCVTSPPYYGLRDYGTAKWEGGDAMCDHRADGERRQIPHGDGRPVETDSYANVRALIPGAGANFKSICGKCGALRIDDQLGLEETPEAYITAMVEVFRCVWDVLEDDGTLWLNIGDSYNGSGGQGTKPNIMSKEAAEGRGGKAIKVDGIKPKDLIGIPWMLAFALRADGWYLRQDIIWHKPNPMPESVQDRCTKAHEYIFLLSKSQKYYFDNEAIAEPLATAPHKPGNNNAAARSAGPNDRGGHSQWDDTKERVWCKAGYRNKRSVWTVTTKPYSGAHFATFPPD